MNKEHYWTSLNIKHENTEEIFSPEYQYCLSHCSCLLCCWLMYLMTTTAKFPANPNPEKTFMAISKLPI